MKTLQMRNSRPTADRAAIKDDLVKRVGAKLLAGVVSAALAVGALSSLIATPAGAASVGYSAYALFDDDALNAGPDYAVHVEAAGPLYTLTFTRWANGARACEGTVALKVGEFAPNLTLASARLAVSRTFPCAAGATSLSVQWAASTPLERCGLAGLCRSASATSSLSSASSAFAWMSLGL